VRILCSFITLAVLGAMSSARAAPDNLDKRSMSAKEVARYFEPYAPGVRGCYIAHARNAEATGVLRLELVIHHHGAVFRFGFVAPGVSKGNLGKLDACLRKLAATWRFPVRDGFTSAVLPFIYLKTNAPGAGPIESCWDPKGCPTPAAPKGKP